MPAFDIAQVSTGNQRAARRAELTFRSVTSPITLKHTLVFDLFYGIQSDDTEDSEIQKKGHLQRYRRTKAVTIAHVNIF